MDVRKQAIVNTAGNIVYFFSLWLLTVLTTQLFGYKSVGALTLAMAIGNVVAMIQLFGMRGYQSSDIKYSFTSSDYIVSRVFTCVAGLIVAIVACIFLDYSKEVFLSIILFCLLKTTETFSDALFGNDQRLGHLEYAGCSMLVRGIIILLFFFIGAFFFQDLNCSLLFAAIGGLLVTVCMDIPLYRRLHKREIDKSNNDIKQLLTECFPLLLVSIIPVVITAVPRVVLERFYGSVILGYYGNVSSPALLLTTVIPTILTALLPGYGMAYDKGDYRSIKMTWIKSIIGTVILTMACIIGVVLFGKTILALVYTKQIIPYVLYLYFVLLAMMIYAITMCNNTLLVAIRKNWGMTKIAFVALGICMFISVPVVKTWGINGAIAVLTLSYGMQAVIQIIWIIVICRADQRENK